MDQSDQLVMAMAEELRKVIQDWEAEDSEMPTALQRPHLEWMCARIERHAHDWPTSRLNRWVGFIQCALIANRVLDLDQAKRMFDRAKIAFPESDDDLLDHLDQSSSFEFDLGGPD